MATAACATRHNVAGRRGDGERRKVILLSEFTGRFYQLEQGQALSTNDQTTLIHKTFAEKNNIKPDDKLDIAKTVGG